MTRACFYNTHLQAMIRISSKDDVGSRVFLNDADRISMGPGTTKQEIKARVVIRGNEEIGPGLGSATEERDILNETDELRDTTIGISHMHSLGSIDGHLDDRSGDASFNDIESRA